MLSEHFPVWVVAGMSAVFNLISGRIPGSIKPWALFALAVAATVVVVGITPELGWDMVFDQALALLAASTVGYTLFKGVDSLPAASLAKVGTAVVLLGLMSAGLWFGLLQPAMVQAQAVGAPEAGIELPPPGGSVQQFVSVWAFVGLTLVNGLLGRFAKRLGGLIARIPI